MRIAIEFCHAPIVPPARPLAAREIGACVDFLGIVRETENNSAVTGLFYEAYEPMARLVLEKILAELEAEHPCDEVLIIHRLGFVAVGEASILVRAQSSHRHESLTMVSKLMDRLKSDAPIWKSLKGRF